MKKCVALCFAFFAVFAVTGQTFEGKIIYQNAYKSKVATVSDDQWNAMLGTRQEYVIKNGDYKSSTNGHLFQWLVYINKENKLYSKLASSETLYWNDGSENKDEVLESKLNKDVVEILGNKCDELVLVCKSGIQKYYFAQKYKVDTSLFAQHKFGNWYDYLRIAGAIPLKQVIEN